MAAGVCLLHTHTHTRVVSRILLLYCLRAVFFFFLTRLYVLFVVGQDAAGVHSRAYYCTRPKRKTECWKTAQSSRWTQTAPTHCWCRRRVGV